jgi:putative colanic acid biosynthesis glycosyltransferase
VDTRCAVSSGGARSRSPAPRDSARPLVSVITVTYNAARSLPACLESVAGQTYRGVEHVVVDGGSTDGTLDVLRAWDERLAWWVSEPDRGIYDAMNKGIDAARGEWIYFLGADDTLAAPDVVERCLPHLRSGVALVYGDVRYSTGQRLRSIAGPELLIGNTVHHQGALYAARVFDGWRYDPTFRLIADYELNLRLYLAKEPRVRADVVIADCAEAGASRTRIRQSFREMNAIRRRHVGWLANAPLTVLLAAHFARDLAYRGLRRLRAGRART